MCVLPLPPPFIFRNPSPSIPVVVVVVVTTHSNSFNQPNNPTPTPTGRRLLPPHARHHLRRGLRPRAGLGQAQQLLRRGEPPADGAPPGGALARQPGGEERHGRGGRDRPRRQGRLRGGGPAADAPLPLFKYLPHRYRRTAFARRVLRRVIEGAVGDRGVRLLFLIFGPAWPCLGLNGRGPLPPLDHASSSSPFTHTGTRRGGK